MLPMRQQCARIHMGMREPLSVHPSLLRQLDKALELFGRDELVFEAWANGRREPRRSLLPGTNVVSNALVRCSHTMDIPVQIGELICKLLAVVSLEPVDKDVVCVQ